ncbi:hypothetical protein Barb6XT_00221 [Bacteroidales bacterium Barb6XT]|nr:hypothetical protein Barb6XT_00221 [Bacteroidales bacterium Barb6XT]
MKKIDKKEEPTFYSKYIKQHKPTQWDDIAPVRSDLRAHIWEEQKRCCAYTEVLLNLNKDNFHIDHYKTQNLYPQLTFDYSNLLVSCNSEKYGAKHKDKLIKGREEYENLINPVEESPSEYMEFTFTGHVEAVNSCRKGEETIRLFNLNEKSLVERRKTALSCFNMEGFTEEDLVQFVGEFETMIRQLYHSMQ